MDSEGELLSPKDAAIFLGVTIELVFQFTKLHFTKSSVQGKTWFRESELTRFDKLLSFLAQKLGVGWGAEIVSISDF